MNGFTDADQFGGGNIVAAIAATKSLLATARVAGILVAFTRVVYADDASDAGVFCLKAPGLKALTENAPESQVVDDLTPAAGEYVIRKTQPSAFLSYARIWCLTI